MSGRKDELDSYEEQVKKEFESTQNIATDLGRVDLNKGNLDLEDDPNVRRINDMISYQDVPLESLPSRGRYLPIDTNIRIRAARAGEIREFSTMDEDNIKDVTDKLTYIISQCVKVYYGNTPGNYKDIISSDRIVLILKIRELTFKNGAESIKIPVPDNACKTVGCHPQEFINFNTSILNFVEPPQEFEKYYDSANRCYNIQTKRFGEIAIYPPNIGVTTAVTDWVASQQREGKKFDVALAEILQFVIKDWRGLSDRMIKSKLSELSSWSTEKFALVYRIIEKISVGIDFNVTTTCETCGGEIVIPITFPEGYKSLFVPTISDLGDELL